MNKTWTILEILNWTTKFFEKKGIETPKLDAEILLSHTLNVRRIDLYIHSHKILEKEELTSFRKLVEERAGGHPVAYLVGHKEFMSLKFKVTPDVLIPRPETEFVVEEVLDEQQKIKNEEQLTILDIGTGCGNIAISLAVYISNQKSEVRSQNLSSVLCPLKTDIYATDISPKALEIAKENAISHKVKDRITFLEGDLFEPLKDRDLEGRVDFIVSNPPYVGDADKNIAQSVRNYEPKEAVFAGVDGTSFHKKIIKEAKVFLKNGGFLIFEIGVNQKEEIEKSLKEEGFSSIEITKDYSQIPRVIKARRVK